MMASYLVGTIIACEILYSLIMLYMYVMQRNILFQPEADLLRPKDYELNNVEDDIIIASDGIQLGCWYAPPKKEHPIILYFHGNAGHIGHRIEKIHAFLEYNFGICAPSYRGYGKSGGKPSEKGTYRDAEAAINLLYEKGFKDKDIILYGESLGSGIAVEMAKRHPDATMLVLEAPYTSTADRGIERYPFLPVYLLMKDQYDSLSKIPLSKAPVLLFHGEQDETIPIHHGKALYNSANNPKKAVFFPECDHVNFNPKTLTKHIELFYKASRKK